MNDLNDASRLPTEKGNTARSVHWSSMSVAYDPANILTDGEDDDGPVPGIPGHADSVQAMHDVFMREHAEPKDGFEPVPFWVAIVCGGLLMWGGFYVGTNSAEFQRDVFDRSNPARSVSLPVDVKEPEPQTVTDYMKIGTQVYNSRCNSCHGPEGKGGKGVPPLAGSDWVVGTQAGSARQARIVLYGIQGKFTVNGEMYKDNMPAWGLLRDYQLASVLTYVRNSWGNQADSDDGKPGITTSSIVAARAKEGLKRAPFTEDELKTIPVAQVDGVQPVLKDNITK